MNYGNCLTKILKLPTLKMIMLTASASYEIFNRSILDYHAKDNVDTPMANPFPTGSMEELLYKKNWIDTVQWHLEDIIRMPSLDPAKGMEIKRRIDKSNQERTDTVEKIDDFFLSEFSNVLASGDTRINSETPAWLLDRMSILMLKIYHMREQTIRRDVPQEHLERCGQKLALLLEQKEDMRMAFDELIEDIRAGKRKFKVYRQVKMYNDKSLNPMLYNESKPNK
jgi:hypothetical protein